MASVTYRLKTPSRAETTIICRFYSKETGPLDFSTGEKIPTEFWQGQKVSAKYKKNHDRINRSLAQLECDLLDIWRQNKGADKGALKALVTKRVKGEPSAEKKTVIDAVEKFIAQYESEKEKSTAGRYRVLKNKLIAFNPDLTFADLDQNFYDEFKKWLYGNNNPLYSGYDLRRDPDGDGYILVACDSPVNHVGLFDDVVFKYFINLQTVIRWAEKRDYQVLPSYKEWEIIKRDYPIINLTIDELYQVEGIRFNPDNVFEDWEIENLLEVWQAKNYTPKSIQKRLNEVTQLRIDSLNIARDYLSIACRTGQRISDIKRISSLAISGGNWTIYQKKGSRQKQKVVQLPMVGFCEPVKDIISKYGGQLPTLSEQKLNEHIKTICKLVGITQEIFIERWQGNKKIKIPGKKYEFISTHSGKKTFITALGNMGVPVKVISDFTGTSIKTIEKHYLGRTELYVAEKYLKSIEGDRQLKKVI